MSQYETSNMHHNGLNCGTISNTHKRTTSKPDFSSYVPSPKRQQLNNFWSMECQTSVSNPLYSELPAKTMFDSLFEEKQVLESQEEAPRLPDLSDNDDGNIANTPAYIKSLINLVQAPDEGYSDDCIPISREESINQLPTENIPSLFSLPSEDAEILLINNNNPVEDETDDAFLNNLPTSVDDLQHKELHLKLERNYSSPMVSRRQSPALYVGRTSLASERSFTFSSTHSVVSDDEDLDEDDLEVAMINESFEEQQKQSMLYEGANLKSLFYSMPNQKLRESDLDEADLAYILNSSNPSTPSKAFDNIDGSNTNTDCYNSIKESMLTPSAGDYDTDDNISLLLTPKTNTFKGSTSDANFTHSFTETEKPHFANDDEFSSDGLDAQLENMILRGEFDNNPNYANLKKTSFHEGEIASREERASEAAEALAKDVVASLFAPDLSSPHSFGVEESINLTDSLCKCLGFLSDSEPEDYENDTSLKEKSSISNVDSGADLTSSSSQADFHEISKLSRDEQKVPESTLDSWENLDESELEQKIIDTVKMKQQSVKGNILDVPSTSECNFDVLPHVLEVSNITSKTTDNDLNDTISLLGFDSTYSKRVDDGHALFVFPSSAKAIEALMNKRYSGIRLRPLSDSAVQTKQKAIAWKDILKPNIPRPPKNASVARRMIENTIGIKSSVSKETRKKEDTEIKLARASKKLNQSLWSDA